ncbi:MAG: hypothetical protein KA796_01820 [Chryseobacterium sp.]|mgnify:FL=1|nr:hypothetical protein [Chryseobacterium sp.]
MKKLISTLFLMSCSFVFAQEIFPPIVPPKITYRNLNSKKEALVEKKIFPMGDFKDLNFQKIILKNLSDNSSVAVFAIMTQFETFDNISKRTITFEKDELAKLIQSLQTMEQNSITNPEQSTKFKYTTKDGIEIGSVYNSSQKLWENYINMSSVISMSIIKFNTKELKELVQLLKKAEKSL